MHPGQYLRRKLTSEKLDARMGQVACWLAAAIILVAGLFKLTTMQLTEPELFFGILLTLAVALLGVVLGVLLPMAQSFDQWQRDRGNR